MTEEEKLTKHVDGLINGFNDAYKEYRNSVVKNKGSKGLWCHILAGCAFGIAKDFLELENLHEGEVEDDQTM